MKKDLIDYLEDLRVTLNNSGVERTSGLKKAMGNNCYIYRRSRDKYLSMDHEKIKEAFLKVVEQYKVLNEKEFFVTSPPESKDI